MPITPEARERFVKRSGMEIPADVKEIPEKYKGLGYQWYPVVLTSKTPETLETVRSQMIFQAHIYEKPVFNTENDVIDDILARAIAFGSTAAGRDLGLHIFFLDPKEVTDAIDTIKAFPNSRFFGFIPAIGYAKIYLDREVLYIEKDTCGLPVKTTSWQVIPRNIMRDPKDGRIFNWYIELNVSPLSNSK
ncbi:Hypothetical protein HVR_LOCUS501 [uncultured virus]|nr:Hypothetical protein HVR_LOCUS501 [uncultured virus]